MTDELKAPKGFNDFRRSYWITFQCIGIFILSCWGVYVNFGFWPALLFVVYPLNVSGAAWKIGAYLYMTTIWFMMVTWYLTAATDWGVLIALPFFWIGLECSLSAIPFAFILPLYTRNPYTLVLFIPLIIFLAGKRFQGGLAKRIDVHKNLRVDDAGKWNWRRSFIMIKVMGYYIALTVWPSRLGFFHEAGYYIHNYHKDKYFRLSLCVIGLFLVWGFTIDPLATMAWFLAIGLYSQYLIYGQFVTERYTYQSNLFFCILLSKYFEFYPQALIVLATLYFYHSFVYIRIWRNNESLFRESWAAFPMAAENCNNLAADFMKRGRFDLAITPLLWTLKCTPNIENSNNHFNLGQCYGNVGQFAKALDHFLQARLNAPLSQLPEIDKLINDCNNKLVILHQQKKALKKSGVFKQGG